MCEHIEDHHSNAKLLATTLGKVNGTLRQAKETVMDTKEDWKVYRNTSTDHEVPSKNNLSLVQLAQDSNCSVPHEAAAAQTAHCTPATKAATVIAAWKKSEEDNKSGDEDVSKDNLS